MNIDYASLLNSSQLKAVTTRSQYVRIIAGAGSGKTRVLTYRIAFLLNDLQAEPSSILAVTFTNKAANEMKARVEKLCPNQTEFLNVSTFHSFCARFLRHNASCVEYPSSFTILDEDDVEKLIKDICVEKGYKKADPFVKNAVHAIDKWKTKGLYPENVSLSDRPGSDEKECLEVYEKYEERKRAMLSFDFDDLILVTLKILENFPEVRERYQRKFRHILIDEYQDTNDVQYKLINLLVSMRTSVYVVGDPDQTIYTWRGANQGIILNFPKDFDPCEDIVLDRNYRSTKTILAAANRLIAHNQKRVKKDLYTEEEEGTAIIAKRFETPEEEAKFVVDKILDVAGSSWPVDFSNIVVLYRSSYLTRPFEAEFASNSIPYRIFGGLRFYQRKEVKDVLAYFNLLENDLNDVAFERIVNVPRRGIGDNSIRKIKLEAAEKGLSEYQYCSRLHEFDDTEIPTKAINALTLLIARMEKTKQELAEGLETYGAILRRFIADIDYYAYITEDQGIDEDRAGNVNALFDDINRYINDHPDSTFSEYLQNVSLLTSQDDMNGGNYVSLMTIHVAKGLEFDNVFIIGMNEGAFPSMRAQMDKGKDGLEEERRLAYVAMTRAKKMLCMTTNSAYTYTTDSHATPSQFFAEAGIELPESKRREDSFFRRPSSSYGGKSSWKSVSFADRNKDFFGDDDFDPFDEKPPKKEEPPKPTSNGITDWKVGDRVHHDKFGDGMVVEVIDESIIVVSFETAGKKTLLSSHPMIHRLPKKGAEA